MTYFFPEEGLLDSQKAEYTKKCIQGGKKHGNKDNPPTTLPNMNCNNLKVSPTFSEYTESWVKKVPYQFSIEPK